MITAFEWKDVFCLCKQSFESLRNEMGRKLLMRIMANDDDYYGGAIALGMEKIPNLYDCDENDRCIF